MSGLITLLTVADILSKEGRFEDYRHQIAFLALAGEPWDYMGSRRSIVELTPGDHSVFGNAPPINLASVSTVITFL